MQIKTMKIKCTGMRKDYKTEEKEKYKQIKSNLLSHKT